MTEKIGSFTPAVNAGARVVKAATAGAATDDHAAVRTGIAQDNGKGIGKNAFKDGVAPSDTLPMAPLDAVLPTLKVGSKGPDVEALQKLLKAADPSLEADGVYGPKTEAAVRKYQQERGLRVDGIAGPETHAALLFDQAIGEAKAMLKNPPNPQDPAETRRWVAAVKAKCKEAGEYLGELRPESKAARNKMAADLAKVDMEAERRLIATIKPEEVAPVVCPPWPAIEPEDTMTQEQIDAKVALVSKGGMDIRTLAELALADQLGDLPEAAQWAAIERLTGDYKGVDGSFKNMLYGEAGAVIAVQLMAKRPTAETAQRILDAMDDDYQDRFIRSCADWGFELDAATYRVLRENVAGSGKDDIDADELRSKLAQRELHAR